MPCAKLANDALLASGVPIFVRGNKLVEPVMVYRPAADGRTTLSTVFEPLGEPAMRFLLNRKRCF